MRDRVTANLPAISFDETAAFYRALGFTVEYQGEDWMVLTRGDLEIEFFPHPTLTPSESWFSACVRVGDVDSLHREWVETGLPEHGIPRLTQPADQAWGFRMFALIDPNGSLLRCMTPLTAAMQDR